MVVGSASFATEVPATLRHGGANVMSICGRIFVGTKHVYMYRICIYTLMFSVYIMCNDMLIILTYVNLCVCV